jgi:hypothetical protein
MEIKQALLGACVLEPDRNEALAGEFKRAGRKVCYILMNWKRTTQYAKTSKKLPYLCALALREKKGSLKKLELDVAADRGFTWPRR